MQLSEMFDASDVVLNENRRPSPEQLVELVKQAAPDVYELWLYGKHHDGTARRNDPWTYIAVVGDDTSPEKIAETQRALQGLSDAIPGVKLQFFVSRDKYRFYEISSLYAATRGEGRKIWTDRSRSNAGAQYKRWKL